jgi:hypothetical protein
MGELLPCNAAERICVDCGDPFPAGKSAKYCPTCRPLNRAPKRTKYVLDGALIEVLRQRYDTRVRGRVAQIAGQLGWPTFAVKRAAHLLGLSQPWPADRRDWTAAEVAELQKWLGVRSAAWIAERLGRGLTSVALKIKRLGLSRRIIEGYTQRSLAECFGVDDHTVARWIGLRYLGGRRDGTDRPNDTIRISEVEVLRFLRSHRLEYRLDKVDQTWFLGLVLGAPAETD